MNVFKLIKLFKQIKNNLNKMSYNKMSQSEIDALLKDSDF